MKIKELSTYQPQEIDSLLTRIPFFKDLQAQTSSHLATLLRYSCMVELSPGETIMRRGDRGSWLYFLVKGRLAVFLDEDTNAVALNHITPGELFGDLALLCDHERKATVAAEVGKKTALLFATDFKPFGELGDFRVLDLPTKLLFYRTMVHSIRWRLEVKRMQQSTNPLALRLRSVPIFAGNKDTEDELRSLFEQAQYLALVLEEWNNEGIPLEGIMVADAASVASL
jgi:CRP-like cAMP-binding protein